MQDQPFAFTGNLIIMLASSQQGLQHGLMIDFLLRATEREGKSALKRPKYFVSNKTQGSVCRK